MLVEGLGNAKIEEVGWRDRHGFSFLMVHLRVVIALNTWPCSVRSVFKVKTPASGMGNSTRSRLRTYKIVSDAYCKAIGQEVVLCNLSSGVQE